MSPAELVIFDCDGVLVDSERISVRVGTAIMAELGWHLTERDFAERFVGCSAEHFHREVNASVEQVLEPDWEERYSDRYRRAFESDLEAVAGVVDVLTTLDAYGVPVCVASNSDHAHIQHVLGVVGLRARLAGLTFSAEDVAAGKPAPDLFLHAARTLGADPERCVVVEDSPYGVMAARAAGMRCYAYAGGLTPRDRLCGLGAVVFDDMADLPGLLGLPPPTELELVTGERS
jgi:HAD superfamily hydrolase (TIGR01509 family)